MIKICSPALIYIIFSLCQILIDIYIGLYNTAFMKTIVAILITFLLNALCEDGLGVVSWIIVFIPFILMTFIVAMLLYIFGLKATTGTVKNINTVMSTQNSNTNSLFTWIPIGSSSYAYES